MGRQWLRAQVLRLIQKRPVLGPRKANLAQRHLRGHLPKRAEAREGSLQVPERADLRGRVREGSEEGVRKDSELVGTRGV